MKGIGTKISFDQAAQWAEKAVKHDDPFGQAIWGAYLLNVKGKKDEGCKFIRKSAEAGNPGGLYMLFRCLYYGRGCEANKDERLKCLEQSSYHGFPDAISKLQILRRNQ